MSPDVERRMSRYRTWRYRLRTLSRRVADVVNSEMICAMSGVDVGGAYAGYHVGADAAG